ncbi:porin family protein [Cecembia lonarensis]|uniref:Outer membrane protein beta-barrel domain-containing protein n=1 Tax=Cecembia lonarensis (strain CCUG 58316 / KCTC 22772 / LW9) TaxID=1225176 RepID=K1LDV2_CECL9|nr:porin family protein [Cecembia lonarensis]EKB48583.1 hypothetical protein B879_02808 [Cecembia lonarensis LW9]
MKKFFISICLLIFAFGAKGQEFSIGPKLGVSQSSLALNGEGFTSGEDKIGYHLGLFVRMGGNSIFAQPEFLFTNTGGSIVQQMPSGAEEVLQASFNRLDVPLMFGFKLASFFRIQAGPIASVLIDYKLEDALQNARELDYSSSTLGYQAGIGLDIGNLILDFKFENSLGRIARSVVGFETDQRQNQLILSAGFRLF